MQQSPDMSFVPITRNTKVNLNIIWIIGEGLPSVIWSHLVLCRKDLVLDKNGFVMDFESTENRKMSDMSFALPKPRRVDFLGSCCVDGQNGVTERSWGMGLQRKADVLSLAQFPTVCFLPEYYFWHTKVILWDKKERKKGKRKKALKLS